MMTQNEKPVNGGTYYEYLRSLDCEEFLYLCQLERDRPDLGAEGDPATWGPETDGERWEPTPDVFPDECPELPPGCDFEPGEDDAAWWAGQPQEGGCGPDEMGPSDRLIAACESELAFQLRAFPGGGRP